MWRVPEKLNGSIRRAVPRENSVWGRGRIICKIIRKMALWSRQPSSEGDLPIRPTVQMMRQDYRLAPSCSSWSHVPWLEDNKATIGLTWSTHRVGWLSRPPTCRTAIPKNCRPNWTVSYLGTTTFPSSGRIYAPGPPPIRSSHCIRNRYRTRNRYRASDRSSRC